MNLLGFAQYVAEKTLVTVRDLFQSMASVSTVRHVSSQSPIFRPRLEVQYEKTAVDASAECDLWFAVRILGDISPPPTSAIPSALDIAIVLDNSDYVSDHVLEVGLRICYFISTVLSEADDRLAVRYTANHISQTRHKGGYLLRELVRPTDQEELDWWTRKVNDERVRAMPSAECLKAMTKATVDLVRRTKHANSRLIRNSHLIIISPQALQCLPEAPHKIPIHIINTSPFPLPKVPPHFSGWYLQTELSHGLSKYRQGDIERFMGHLRARSSFSEVSDVSLSITRWLTNDCRVLHTKGDLNYDRFYPGQTATVVLLANIPALRSSRNSVPTSSSEGQYERLSSYLHLEWSTAFIVTLNHRQSLLPTGCQPIERVARILRPETTSAFGNKRLNQKLEGEVQPDEIWKARMLHVVARDPVPKALNVLQQWEEREGGKLSEESKANMKFAMDELNHQGSIALKYHLDL